MESKYYILSNKNETKGPFNYNELIEQEIKVNSQIWVKGEIPKVWKEARYIPELIPALKEIKRNQIIKDQNQPPPPPQKNDYSPESILVGSIHLLPALFYSFYDPTFLSGELVDLVLSFPWIVIYLCYRILALIMAHHTAKNLNRFPEPWLVFCFLLPGVSLVILGLLKEKEEEVKVSKITSQEIERIKNKRKR